MGTAQAAMHHALSKMLDSDLQNWLTDHCWVYRDDPVEEWGAMHLVTASFREDRTPEHARLTKARKSWESLLHRKRIEEIALACHTIYQEYPKGFIAMPSLGTLDPLPKEMREAGAAAVENKINFLSDTAFTTMAGTRDHHMLIVENIETLLKDGELYVRRSDINDENRESLLDQIRQMSMKQSLHGETLIQHNRNCALVVPEKSLIHHLEDWIYNGLKNLAQ